MQIKLYTYIFRDLPVEAPALGAATGAAFCNGRVGDKMILRSKEVSHKYVYVSFSYYKKKSFLFLSIPKDSGELK